MKTVPAHYDYDNFQRLQAVRDQDRNIVQTYEYNYQQAGTALNDIKARTVLISGQTTVSAVNALTGSSVRRIFQYMDGLERPIQTNAVEQSPTSKDAIIINQYDQYGREPKQYIPYTNTTSSGGYRSAALTEQAAFGTTYGAGAVAFAESVFEPSPLNRVMEQGAPGTTWQTGQGASAHTIRYTWKGNLSAEEVHDFTNDNSFGDNKLWRTEIKDENGKIRYNYIDKLGRIVMVKHQILANLTTSDDIDFARTYTVYDDFGRVAAVIPPEAAKIMKNSGTSIWNYTSATYSSMVYLYTYDSRGRMISKSVPSGGVTNIAYDRLDRPVMATDPNGFKIFTRYDILSRPVVSGRYKGSGTPGGSDPLFETPNTTAPHYSSSTAFPTDNNLDVYKVLYYDDYDIDNNGSLGAMETYTNPAEAGYETTAFLRTKGKQTVIKTAILKNDNSAPTTYLTTRTYFDKEYSVIQVNKQNHLGGSDISSSAYNFADRVIKTRRDHTATPPGGSLKTYTIREEYIYDPAGRIRFTRHNALTGTGAPPAGTWVVASAPLYDELDRMVDKRLHASNYDGTSAVTVSSSFNYLQSLDYTYNIRGWLTNINDVTTCTTQSGDNLGDMFKMSLTYESTATGGTAQYNGNISTMQWSTSVNTTTCSNRSLYRFSYNNVNQLTSADYLIWTGGWTAVNNYTESNINYDLNGNIKTYIRRGLTSGTSTFGNIDQLTYTYGDAARPDRLTKVADTGSNTKGFKSGGPITGDHYLYDANGNMTEDKHKGFVIAYNYMNLPITFTKSANVITMAYTADGVKLSKAVTGGGATKNYLNGIEYNGVNLEAIYHKEGRLTPNGTNFYYEYTLKDHLGNARINFRANGTGVTFLEEQHYYPFGMRMEGIGATAVTDSPYEYNGKEFNDDFSLGLSDYGARWYDASLGRWWSIDPLNQIYPNTSTYGYVKNNSIGNIDIDGRQIYDKNGNKANIEYGNSTIKITNADKLDTKLVSTLINTFLESETGKNTIKKLDKNGRKYQITISEKIGIKKYEDGGYLAVAGVTYHRGGVGKYNEQIFIFNRTRKYDKENLNIEDFDLVIDKRNFASFASDEEKKESLEDIKGATVWNTPEKHLKAYNNMTTKELEYLREIIRISQFSIEFCYVTVLLHEATHAFGDNSELGAFKAEIQSFIERNEKK